MVGRRPKAKEAQPSRKRPNEENDDTVEPPKSKKQKVSHESHATVGGIVLTLGEGDVGQLGLGEDILERSRPSKVDISEDIIQVFAGGMHTVCLTSKGEVITFGCNDDGALGRDTSEEGSETLPAKVELPSKVVQVSAGDSHTAALTEEGKVYIWGIFRDANGLMGMITYKNVQKTPVQFVIGSPKTVVVKIVSGGDHLACLTSNGEIYTAGNAEQGQLGRVAECFAVRGGRKGAEYLLTPGIVRCRRSRGRKSSKFSDIWAGTFDTFAREAESGDIYAWGLNNYYQLGIDDMENRFMPERLTSFEGKQWKSFASGQHHTVALDTAGKVYSLGRKEYGRLGLGKDCEETKEPTLITSLNGTGCQSISAGSSVSFAVSNDGVGFSWGMGTNQQLGTGNDDDVYEPIKIAGKQLLNREVIMISAGGQHTVLLAKDKPAEKEGS
ncbi:regulator of chromosome condensation-like [Tubulanus polymorphus]|uniref:regulator of chromosome condensation-like n=1 Tax=Tubulanus polymorphus TaxID=672921 RepID=UPI003DA428BB